MVIGLIMRGLGIPATPPGCQDPGPVSMPLGSISLKHFVLLFRRFIFFPDLCCLFLTLIPSSCRINLREEIEAIRH